MRDLDVILRPPKGSDLVADLAVLRHCFYPRGVLLVVVAPADGVLTNSASNRKKLSALTRQLVAAPGPELLLCRDAGDVARHLVAALQRERSAGRGLAPPLGDPRVLAFLREVPGVSLAAALALQRHFRGRRLQDLVHANGEDLAEALPWTSDQQRANIRHFFARTFEEDGLV